MARAPPSDVRLLFASRAVRMFAYGFLSVVLVLYLVELGISESRIGLLLSATLFGDTAISLWMTTRADRLGRRRMLLLGAALMFGGGAAFAATHVFWALLLAATVGVISPSGNEVGPFLALEQAALAQSVEPTRRTGAFAWYSLVGSFATALGSLVGGTVADGLQRWGMTPASSYRWILLAYAAAGALLFALSSRLTRAVEAPPSAVGSGRPAFMESSFGLHRSRRVVVRLSSLFAVGAFARYGPRRALRAFLHLADGRPHPAVLPPGGGRAGRAFGSRRHHRDRPHRGRLAGAGGRRAALRQPRPGQHSLLHRRRSEGGLRSRALPELSIAASPGGARAGAVAGAVTTANWTDCHP